MSRPVVITCAVTGFGAEAGSPDWREGCDGMIAFATTKGWVDEDARRVRAHIER